MDNDTFTVVAAGNEGPQTLTMEASVEKAIVVGACTKEDVALYLLNVVGTDLSYVCIASKQTLGIKEEEYNIFVAGGSHNIKGYSAILVYNEDDDYFNLAEGAKKEGADLMIVGESDYLKHRTTTLPSVHCHINAFNDLEYYVSQNENVSITIERFREGSMSQDR